MTPPVPHDGLTERYLVSALVADPSLLSDERVSAFAAINLLNHDALTVMSAIRNLEAAGLPITPAAVVARIEAEIVERAGHTTGSKHHPWLDDLIGLAVGAPPSLPAVHRMIERVTRDAAARRAMLEAADQEERAQYEREAAAMDAVADEPNSIPIDWTPPPPPADNTARLAACGISVGGDAPPDDRDVPHAGIAMDGDKVRTAWTTPTPLGERLPPVLAFVVDLLPADLQTWVCDIAHRMSVPVDLPAAAAMCAVSVVAANARTIHPKRRDSWRVWPILWGAVIAPPGSKKTPSTNEVFRPLETLEIRARQDFERARSSSKAEQTIAKLRLDALTGEIKAALKKSEDTEDLQRRLTEEIERQEVESLVKPRRFLTQDATVEKITEIVGRGAERRSYPLCVKADELLGFFATFDREGRESDRAFYLTGWGGGSDRAVDRVIRGSVLVRDLAIGVFGNATPEPFETYVREATQGAGADGLLQRFQLMIYPDPPPRGPIVDEHKDAVAERRAVALFERLAAIDDDDDDGRPPALRFADDAQAFFLDWLDGLERELAGSEEHHAIVSHLAKYRHLMPALALVCHLASGPGSEDTPVSLWAAQQAAGWCEYLRAHAMRIYSLAVEPERVLASKIAAGIAAGKFSGEVHAREVYRKLRVQAGVGRPGLELLEDLGWCRLSNIKTGGRPSEIVAFNPLARRVP